MSDEREAWRSKVAEGVCPMCGRGPYRSVAIHMSKAHGVDRFALRDALAVPKRTSLCHPDLAEAARRRAVESDLAHAGAPDKRKTATRRRRTAAMAEYNKRRPPEMVTLRCASCGASFERSARYERTRSRSRIGDKVYCSRPCVANARRQETST